MALANLSAARGYSGGVMAYKTTIVNESNAYEYVWRRLRQFHDIETTVSRLSSERSIGKDQHKNLLKQMAQLSYCLTQAYEFAQSAKTSGSTTRALQAYYSVTALANAEILWRGDGNVSLDRRDKRYHRHGFDLRIGSSVEDFLAVPQVHEDGKIDGLFGLWRDHSRHVPQYAEETIMYPGGTASTSRRVISSITPLSDIPIKTNGFSMMDCFKHTPLMYQHLYSIGIVPELARGVITSTVDAGDEQNRTSSRLTTIIHPCNDRVREEVLEFFMYHPNDWEQLEINSLPGGAIFSVNREFSGDFNHRNGHSNSSPESFSLLKNEMYFVGAGALLNEYGYYFLGLYIMGMISRYHPQKWIKEIQRNSAITHLVDQFIDIALLRTPLLILGQMEDEVLLFD
ncbi:hypothetical protein CU100_10040 [Phyllobacterium endophyticum]|uniref:YaaC-like Protein n=2 Tax=Phyllobacterium endophyticum TaxID=1149773 RepID=A0A2P7AUY1_9HYPH|nr:hypothetical protein CU100_10040 [Phyllobacterium endophyticum]